jgi:methylated-DNA-[protein]-cysteine S-methyltransferase
LSTIPFGLTISYGALAKKIGNPKSVRAVANANGANPLCIFVPCHRIIQKDGGLGGYSAGTNKKQWLLAHEAKYKSF